MHAALPATARSTLPRHRIAIERRQNNSSLVLEQHVHGNDADPRPMRAPAGRSPSPRGRRCRLGMVLRHRDVQQARCPPLPARGQRLRLPASETTLPMPPASVARPAARFPRKGALAREPRLNEHGEIADLCCTACADEARSARLPSPADGNDAAITMPSQKLWTAVADQDHEPDRLPSPCAWSAWSCSDSVGGVAVLRVPVRVAPPHELLGQEECEQACEHRAMTVVCASRLERVRQEFDDTAPSSAPTATSET